MTHDDAPSTAEQHAAIRAAAEARIRYLLWLARELDQPPVMALRAEAAAALRQLVGADK